MTVKAATLKARGVLDDAWHARYPQGMWYWIRWRDGRIGMGQLTRRPTSHTHGFSWQSGPYYVGKSYFAVVEHKTFDSKEKFDAHCEAVNTLTGTPMEVA